MKIYFYDKEGRHGWLANFSNHPINIKGKMWRAVEHYYQAQKFAGTAMEELIASAASPSEAKFLASKYKEKPLSNWNEIKEEVMFEAIKAKFTQYPELAEKLVRTKSTEIVEKTTDDYYWGCGANGTGKNRMGVLLMKLRKELKGKLCN